MRQTVSSGGFEHCRFCYGWGCIACPGERKRYEDDAEKPIFIAKRDNPHDMELLERTFGREALEHAFSSEGAGMQEVRRNAVIAQLLQEMQRIKDK